MKYVFTTRLHVPKQDFEYPLIRYMVVDGAVSFLSMCIQSWDDSKKHEAMKEMQGKRVKITLEVEE